MNAGAGWRQSMHELSLALEACRIAELRAGPRPASAVLRVAVEIGEDSGIEVENFRFCMEALLDQPPFSGARLELLPASGDDLRVSYLEVDDGRPDN
jgi:Zn finger protein HypA/HybF involved in hydrogenase expression